MKTTKIPLLVILGPTATGKSDLAVRLAQKWNGEVISVDSRQVYTGLNIGTGKITKKEMQGIPHHLLDVEDPKKSFSVAEFVKHAQKSIEEIYSRGKLPILCGGTGFYIQALVDGIILPEVKPNPALRKKLEKKSPEELLKILIKLDKDRAETIDPHNPHRLIRAIEIATALGKVPKPKKIASKYNALFIGLTLSPEKLKEKINARLEKRLKLGMIEEAKALNKNGLSWERMDDLGLEYRYLALYLQKKLTLEEMKEKLSTEIYHYAKRQMTWFKRDKRIKWFDAEEDVKLILEL